ncbi:hypothetical protein QQF64_030909 [Cirrhinus molitorella]|uniref:Uncharacterized protein n=1 Tax=Cirrhinus molitorella TaxID=172907 RepID=A0ABR3N4L4_9TELE
MEIQAWLVEVRVTAAFPWGFRSILKKKEGKNLCEVQRKAASAATVSRAPSQRDRRRSRPPSLAFHPLICLWVTGEIDEVMPHKSL